MIRRLYAHNFRCLINFELNLADQSSVLLIGKNGSGKSTVRDLLTIFQKIGRGTNQVEELIKISEMGRDPGELIRLSIEADIKGEVFEYGIALDAPENFRHLRVIEERLTQNGEVLFDRKMAEARVRKDPNRDESKFRIDWHLVGLPILQSENFQDPIQTFRNWMQKMIVISPVPSLILGESRQGSLEQSSDLSNFADWFKELITRYPASYSDISTFLKTVMPDLAVIRNLPFGQDTNLLFFEFEASAKKLNLFFHNLSDGEKCLVICAVVLASAKAYGPLVCYWDEPDNFIDLSEVGHLVTGLRKCFANGGQFIATSHNPEIIRKFSDENTILLQRHSHLEPPIARPISELQIPGDLVNALIRGDDS